MAGVVPCECNCVEFCSFVWFCLGFFLFNSHEMEEWVEFSKQHLHTSFYLYYFYFYEYCLETLYPLGAFLVQLLG